MNYEYLEHHGILGQKWGVRRYQNPDGSYTAEGAKRRKYEKAQTKIESASATVGFKRAKQLAKSGDNKSKKQPQRFILMLCEITGMRILEIPNGIRLMMTRQNRN